MNEARRIKFSQKFQLHGTRLQIIKVYVGTYKLTSTNTHTQAGHRGKKQQRRGGCGVLVIIYSDYSLKSFSLFVDWL